VTTLPSTVATTLSDTQPTAKTEGRGFGEHVFICMDGRASRSYQRREAPRAKYFPDAFFADSSAFEGEECAARHPRAHAGRSRVVRFVEFHHWHRLRAAADRRHLLPGLRGQRLQLQEREPAALRAREDALALKIREIDGRLERGAFLEDRLLQTCAGQFGHGPMTAFLEISGLEPDKTWSARPAGA